MTEFIKICCIIIFLVINSGCIATRNWNEHIDQKLYIDTLDLSANEFASLGWEGHFYRQGYYLGIQEQKGVKYFHYTVPNIYKNPSKNIFDILVPIRNTDKSAIIRSVESDGSTGHANIVYFKFGGPLVEPINPRYLHKGNPSVPVILPTDYPALITLHIWKYGQKPVMRAGQRIGTIESSSFNTNYNRDQRYTLICRDNVDSKDVKFNAVPQGNYQCDMWSWSEMLTSEYEYGTFEKVKYNALRYTGYLVTVPIDVVTSPFQAIATLFFINALSHGH